MFSNFVKHRNTDIEFSLLSNFAVYQITLFYEQ